MGSYLNGRPNGGVHNAVNIALYTYSFHNPVRYFDPDGNAGRDPSSLNSALLDTGKAVLNSGVGLVEGVPNLLTGAIPGGPDYVPFLDGLRSEYDTPAFGMTIEVLTGVGVFKILGEMGAAKSGPVGSVETRGGAHGDVKGIPGNESHHMPANSVNGLSKNKGPAISMKTEHHQQTASWGSSKEAKAYRQQQKELIGQGKFGEAQQMDIKDVQSKFGDMYNDSIKQMLDYTKTIGQ